MAMLMISNLIEEISKNSFEVGTWIWVDVIHINSPHSFYIRPTTYNKYLPVLQLRDSLSEPCKVRIGEVCVFHSELQNCEIRGQIISYRNTYVDVICRLQAMDYGFIVENVSQKSLFKSRYSDVPSLVTHCQLADCTPQGELWNEKATNAMRKLVTGERAIVTIRDKTPGILSVELQTTCTDDISSMLAYFGVGTLGYASNAFNRFKSKKPTYAQRKLEKGATLHVRLQSGNLLERFYVTPIEEYNTYLEERNKFTAEARTQAKLSMNDLKLKSPIGIYYDKNNKYERGIVKELFPALNKAKVQLVDWGFEVIESVTKMQVVPEWYLQVPPRAIFCTRHSQSLQNKSDPLTTLRSQPGIEFLITIIGIGNENGNGLNSVQISLVNG